MIYSVRYTDQVRKEILKQARYISVDCCAPVNAGRWLGHVWDTVNTLEEFPRRGSLAPENDSRPFEIRNINVGDYLLAYTIDEDVRTVWVIGFRHGSQLPRSDDLPDEVPSE